MLILKNGIRNRKVQIGVAFVLIVNLFLFYIGVYGGNVHTVAPNVLYRSAQLTDGTLARVIDADHIASVINLRGASPDAGYYNSELDVCRQHDVAHADVSMSARRLPAPAELNKLVADFDRLPKPILVHCKAGSDRTGLASTLFLTLESGEDLNKAESAQLTWRYGHFGVFGTEAMDHFYDLYRQTARSQDLRTWIQRSYPAEYRSLTHPR